MVEVESAVLGSCLSVGSSITCVPALLSSVLPLGGFVLQIVEVGLSLSVSLDCSVSINIISVLDGSAEVLLSALFKGIEGASVHSKASSSLSLSSNLLLVLTSVLSSTPVLSGGAGGENSDCES
mgnify:CR=1 FL=1